MLVLVAVGDIDRRLMAAVAMGLAMGCGPAVTIEDDASEGSSGAPSSGGSTSTSPTSGGTSTSATSVGVTTNASVGGSTSIDPTIDDEPRFDLGPQPPPLDIGGEYEHECPPLAEPPGCEVDVPDGLTLDVFCRQPPVGESCAEWDEERYTQSVDNCILCFGQAAQIVCEPFMQGDMCCTWALVEFGLVCPGRPFVVDGHARVPPVVEREDWSRPTAIEVDGLTVEQRTVLASAWAAEGCHEAASVASFSRFVLQLAAMGSPPSFVDAAQRALADEVEHAKTFFGLATAYGERGVGPGPLPVDGALEGLAAPIDIAVSLANEGCIAETISAMQLLEAARRCGDPRIRAALREIADQELQHAELAWSTLAWMLARGDDEMRAAVATAFINARGAVPRSVSVSDALPADVLRAHGRLDAAARLQVAERALENVVEPTAATLLRPWTCGSAALSSKIHPKEENVSDACA